MADSWYFSLQVVEFENEILDYNNMYRDDALHDDWATGQASGT